MSGLSDESTLLRLAITEVLAHATQPLTSVQIGEAHAVRSLGLDMGNDRMAKTMHLMFKVQRKHTPLARIRVYGKGQTRYGWYNPEVVTPLESKHVEYAATDGPVNPIKSPPEFKFNPLEFVGGEAAALAEPPPAPAIKVPQGVKCITLSVGSVAIKIELTR